MKKRLLQFFVIALCVTFLSSCNGDKTVKTDVPIPTEFAGFVLGGCYTRNECEESFQKYIESFVIIDDDNYGTGKIYNLFPFSLFSSEDFSFAGYNWTYLRLFVNDSNVLSGMQFTFTADEFEPSTDQYENLKNTLSEKYGRAREHKEDNRHRRCRWTDGKTLLVVAVEESTTTTGETKSFCMLCYYDCELQNALENSGKTEL